jgi:hypothetical protein
VRGDPSLSTAARAAGDGAGAAAGRQTHTTDRGASDRHTGAGGGAGKLVPHVLQKAKAGQLRRRLVLPPRSVGRSTAVHSRSGRTGMSPHSSMALTASASVTPSWIASSRRAARRRSRCWAPSTLLIRNACSACQQRPREGTGRRGHLLLGSQQALKAACPPRVRVVVGVAVILYGRRCGGGQLDGLDWTRTAVRQGGAD